MSEHRHFLANRIALWLPALALGCAIALAAISRAENAATPSPRFIPAQKIEVREGDRWSPATVVRQEGRRYLIHYEGSDASTDEWVTIDRMRLPGTTAGPTSVPAAAPKKFFANGSTVEVKSGPWWKKAVVVNHRGEWVLVDIDGKRFWRQWVEPWRVRAVGSTDDIDGWAKDNPWVHHNEDPPAGAPGPPPAPARPHRDQARPGGPNLPEGQDRKPPPLGQLDPLTSLPPDGGEAIKAVAGPIPLRNQAGTPDALVISSSSPIAVVLYRRESAGNNTPQSNIDRVDMSAGRSLNSLSIPIDADLLDLSPEGNLLLTRTSLFGTEGRGAQMDVWDIGGQSAVRVASFLPFPDRNSGGKFIEWGRFIDSEHILTAGNGISCYEFRTQREVWSVDAGPFISHYALSPSFKYLAVQTGTGVAVLDAHSGKPLGKLDLDVRFLSCIAFKPDGRQLAVGGADALVVIELHDCSIASEIWTLAGAPRRIDWGSDGHLLVNHSQLVSLAKNGMVWTYSGLSSSDHGSQGAVLNGRLYYASDRDKTGQHRPPVIASIDLPDKSVRDLLTVVGNPRMLLKPGMSVSLDINVDGSIRQEVIDGLTARLKADGIGVADNQPIRIVAKDESGKTREVTYNLFGPGAMGRTDKVSVQEVHHSLDIIGSDGKTLWANNGLTAPPFFISLKQGESAEQAVAEQMKPNPRFYTDARLPKYIPKPGGGFGTTQLDAGGAHP